MNKPEKYLFAMIIVVIIILFMLILAWIDVTAAGNPIYIVHDVTEGDTPDFVMCSPSRADCHDRALARCDQPDKTAPPVGTPCQLLYGGRFDCGAEFQSPFYVSDLQHPYKSYLSQVGK